MSNLNNNTIQLEALFAKVNALPEAGLPTVTTADNGKFLRVVNGAWAAATIPSAEGVKFGE